ACAGDDGDTDASASVSASQTGASGLATSQGASDSDSDSDSTSGSGSASESSATETGSTTSDSTTTTDATTTDSTTTDATTDGSTTTGPLTTGDSSTTAMTTDPTTTTTTDSGTDSGGMCVECNVTLDSTQSSSFVALQGTEFMGFATLEGDKIIYALDEVGPGRVIYTADTNILYKEVTDCPLWEWLGDSGDQLPKVLSFGRNLCGGLGNNLANYPDLTYAGASMPAQYVNNPAQLAADYDVVIYCTIAGTSDAEAQTVVDFVSVHGGGLYLASEYFGFLSQADVDRINTIGNPLGVDFQTTNLDWGQANGEIGFACFPLPQ
ncbi:MAG: hypothetical protein KC486_28705, partial [Myxococcales bacterium]|nr:hypothetical protein [Myxococcales bacterium]